MPQTHRDDNSFPVYLVGEDESGTGLTKREYFAGLALQGILSRGDYFDATAAASKAVKTADELIEKLNEGRIRN